MRVWQKELSTFSDKKENINSGSFTVEKARDIQIRTKISELDDGSSLTVKLTVNFPSGRQKVFTQTYTYIGAFIVGGWSGNERKGKVEYNGSFDVKGRVVFESEIVSFEKGEDVPVWP